MICYQILSTYFFYGNVSRPVLRICMWILGLKGQGWFSPATEWDSWTIFTLYRKAFALPRKSYRIGRLFTPKNNYCGTAISVTETSCAALIFEVEHCISDRFCVIHWCSVNTYSRAQNNFQAKAGHDDRPNIFYLNHVLFSICERDFIFTRRQNLRFTDEGLVIFFFQELECVLTVKMTSEWRLWLVKSPFWPDVVDWRLFWFLLFSPSRK